jgi:ribosomal protein S3
MSNFRLNFARKDENGIKKIVENWLNDNHLNERCVISRFELYGNELCLYITNPGLAIGYHGAVVDNLKERLNGTGVEKVNFVEVRNRKA